MQADEKRSAVVLGVQLPGVSDEEHDSSLAELARLGKTLGVNVVARVSQRRARLDPGCVVGEGKLRELSVASLRTITDPSSSMLTTRPSALRICEISPTAWARRQVVQGSLPSSSADDP